LGLTVILGLVVEVRFGGIEVLEKVLGCGNVGCGDGARGVEGPRCIPFLDISCVPKHYAYLLN